MRTERSTGANSRTLVDAKMSLSLWLRAGRAQKGLSLEAVAKITKIQPRILERLEAGKLDGLPAEVFVRGFVRSFARCVGLDETEALERYSLAAAATTPSGSAMTSRAGALVDAMSELAPATARSPKALRREPEIIEVAPLVIDAPKPVVEAPPVEMMLPETGTLTESAVEVASEPVIEPVSEPVIEPPPVIAEEPIVVEAVTTSVIEAAVTAIATEIATQIDASAPAVVEAVIAAEVAAVEGVQLGLEAVATVEPAKKGGKRKRGGKRSKRSSVAPSSPTMPTMPTMPTVVARASASGTPAQPTPVVIEAEALAKEGALADAARDVVQAMSTAAMSTAAMSTAAMSTATAVATDELVDATATTTTTAIDATTTASTTTTSAIDATATTTASASGESNDTDDTDHTAATSEPWTPKMPTVVAPSVPWRRAAGGMTSTAAAPVVPSLVIDDADPDSAERELEDRQAAKEPARRSFLPPILLDREDRSARQGGLTLAVIILLIAATLTLSYLMRRPSSTGDGVTQREASALVHQQIA